MKWVGLHQQSCFTLGLVSTWMGDCLQADISFRYITRRWINSVFYPPWHGKMSNQLSGCLVIIAKLETANAVL